MSRLSAALIFLAVVLALCAGAFVISWLIAPTGPGSAARRPGWTPPGAATPTAEATRGSATPTWTPAPRSSSTPTQALPQTRTTDTPTTESVEYPEQTSTVGPTPTPTATATAETRKIAYAFELARPVRNSSGDCPGSYILGTVIDQTGKPMPDVSLRLTDEYGNQQAQTTKKVASELGRYDFPLFGPPRRFYLSVVDAQGRPLSPIVEIAHGVGSAVQATCHWADWQRQ